MILAAALALLMSTTPPESSVVLVQGGSNCGSTAQGSGVVIAPGIVATNAHVVQGAIQVRVHTGGQPYAASAHIIAPEWDLCLLRVPAFPVPPAELGPDEKPVLGSAMSSIGFPGGNGPIIQNGSLKSLWRFRGSHLLQSDAPVRPGSSGGGIFNLEGQLIGLTTFVFFEEPGFHVAVPVVWIRELMQRAWTPGSNIQTCKPREMLLEEFLERMTAEPANRAAFEAFSRTWVKSRPRDPEAWFSLGHILSLELASGNRWDPELSEAAKAAYRKALELNPAHPKALNNLGVALDNDGKLEESVEAFRMAIRITPTYGLAWINLGGGLLSLRRWPEAAEAFRTGLRHEGDNPLAWARLGFCELQCKRPQAAVRALQIAQRYRPLHLDGWVDLLKACRLAKDKEAETEAWATLEKLGPERVTEVRKRLASGR